MTTTLADVQYVDEALEALEAVTTDRGLSDWSDRFTNNERYIELADKLVKRLEDAYNKRADLVCGVGA